MSVATVGKPAPLWLRVLRWPVEPSQSLDAVDRRSAGLLLWLELVVIAALLANFVFAPYEIGTRLAMVGVIIAYGITRTRYYKAGGGLMMTVMSLSVLTFFHPSQPNTFDHVTTILLWTALPVGLASMFFNVRGTVLIVLLNLGVIVIAGLVKPGLTVGMALGASAYVLTIMPLLIVVVIHRNALVRLRNAQVSAAMDALKKSEADLEARVAERTAQLERAREQAEESRLRAERADQVKSQFLASMSHELRTPLNAILNFTEMMSLGMVGEITPQQKDILEKSLRSGRHLLDLINDVLDVSKMQSGMLALFVEEHIDIREELTAVVTAAQSLLRDKPVKLVEDFEGALPNITGDRRRIRQILLNLVSNAAKFTEKGTVTISAHRQNGDMVFGVIDTGPGIPLEQQERIFLPFVQTEAGIRQVNGTGLGLAISRHLAEAHGGKLWVESTPGHGSAFYVSLPLHASRAEVQP